MVKFDIVPKISFRLILKSIFKRPQVFPYQLLVKEKIISSSFPRNYYYFDWGRNALFYLFKYLKYKRIAFPAFTCPTLIQAAEAAGKEVILVEVNLDTFNLDIKKIPQNVESLVAVHTFGNPVNINKIRQRFKNIFIIEDCAHALFSQLNNQFVGSQGDAVLFSFYKQTPNINGALLLTKLRSDKRLVARQKQESNFKYLKRLIFKTNGIHQRFLNFKRHQYLPKIELHNLTKNKPSNLTFSLFKKGFKKLKKEIEKRRRIVKWYYQQTKKSQFLIAQKPKVNSNPSYYHFVVRLVPELASVRDKVVLSLRKKNIFLARLWYDAPITQEKFKRYKKICPNALLLARTVINLPIFSSYTSKDISYLFTEINKAIKTARGGNEIYKNY